ncbi:MAG: hypothetical protein E7323_05780 [Clostridiales bacterium]|nr:hypothetical protein [Clostridiales bacterium]
MKVLNQLPEVVDRQLGGLEADARLLARIRINAAEGEKQRYRTGPRFQVVLAACCALVLCIGGVLWAMDPGDAPLLPANDHNLIDTHAAGSTVITTAPPAIGDLPEGTITMSGAGARSGSNLFATGQGNSFPLITAGGATYRMLTYPDGISSALLGSELGLVNEFNLEPALGSGDIVSNAVNPGAPVYAISGMKGAMVAANVSGSLRVFQRVSYSGTATIGGETLEDTLCKPSQVNWLNLNGTTISGAEAQELMQILLDDADFRSTSASGKGSLQIGMTNGLTLQLLVGDDTVSACGTWSCPGFFEAFAELTGQ